MGREIRRVPADFDWPVGDKWYGFVNPHYKECPDCKAGQTASRDALETIVRLLCTAASDSKVRPKDFKPPMHRIRDHEFAVPQSREMKIGRRKRMYPHPYVTEAGITDIGDNLWELVEGLTEEKYDIFGYSSTSSYRIQKLLIKEAGLPEEWGTCPTCKGDRIDPSVKEVYEAWEETPVPKGDWWQLWETVSEGSPISPAFETAEELIDYMSSPPKPEHADRGSPWDKGWSKETAEKFVKGPGWAPSGVSIGGQYMDGVTAITSTNSSKPS